MSRCSIALRQCGDWLALLIGKSLAFDAPPAAQGRLIRLIDATAVPKAGSLAKRENKLWRIHSAFDLPSERFGFFELTDEKGGERSTLATCRLTRPGAWRLLRQLVATFRQAIIPQPTIARLRCCIPSLRRHLHEPPRRRSYQKMARLF
jgi:hypothetical protein